MNLKIKYRESFRPFAPTILEERASEYFGLREHDTSPYMLLVAPVNDDKRVDATADDLRGLDKLKAKRSVVPAITHVDYSARVQTVSEERNGRYYKLVKAFEKLTGSPVVINTSFNVRGEPIVCTPADAFHCFLATEKDALVIENFVLLKEEQTDVDPTVREKHLAQFALD